MIIINIGMIRMNAFLEHVLDEFDLCIRKLKAVDAFDWPMDYPEAEGSVSPILSTFHDEYGLVFIMEIVPKDEAPTYVSISYGDHGVIVGRSKTSRDIDSLKFESRDWAEL